jgi:hypothetical protein
VSNAKMKAELAALEGRILGLLSASSGNILDDEELIDTLAQAKVWNNPNAGTWQAACCRADACVVLVACCPVRLSVSKDRRGFLTCWAPAMVEVLLPTATGCQQPFVRMVQEVCLLHDLCCR